MMFVGILFSVIFALIRILEGHVEFLHEDIVWSSWASVCNGKYWVVVTATFVHASNTHLVNNIAMLLAPSQIIEEKIGSFSYCLLFITTGMVGWIASILSNSIRHPHGGWQWIASCGSSPATYGFVFFLVTVDPRCQLNKSLALISVGVVIAVEFHMFIIQRAHKVKNKLDQQQSVGLLLLLILISSLFLLIDCEITSVQFLYMYVLKSLLFRALTVTILHQGVLNHSSSDHGAHLGGSFTGTVIGVLWTYIHHGQWHDSVEVLPALLLLVVRVLTDF